MRLFKNIAFYALLAIGCFMMTRGMLAQEKPKPAAEVVKFEPTELEVLKLQVKLRDVQIAQINLQQKYAAFSAETEAIKKIHNWPESVHIDISQDPPRFFQDPAPDKK